MSFNNYNNNRKPVWKNERRPEPKIYSQVCPLEVEVRNNDMEQALKVLKGKIAKDGILAELKNRRHYEKPSVKARRKSMEAQKRARKSRGRKVRQRQEVRTKNE